MKAKTPNGAAAAGGDHAAHPMGGASPSGNGGAFSTIYSGSGAGAASDERGMPGLATRGPTSSMLGEQRTSGPSGHGHHMPGGGMGDLQSFSNGGSGGGNRPGGGGTDDDPPQVRQCATMDVHRRLLTTDPAYARIRDEVENETLRFTLSGLSAQRTGITRIPVVVHVVWNSAAQNISDAQITSQIDVLNRDFRRTNPDVATTPSPFLPLATDARIEYFLATTDPFGAPTTGIERRQTSVTGFGADDAVKSAATGGMDAWPAAHYLNIWVCQLSGGLLGYAQFPGGPDATDGVVVRHSAFGTTGTAAAPFNLGRTATHEIGHWLNLNHIWGDDGTGCSGTDNVSDTPNQAGGNTGTPTFPHVSCSNGPHGDMFMNYMDYVDDRAMVMFSAGQVERMQACLDGVRSTIGHGAGALRPSSSPVYAWGTNRIDTFVLGSDRVLNHKAWDGSAWAPSETGYELLGGTGTSVPQAVAWGPNRLDVFITGTDSALYHKWWDGSAWGPSQEGYEYMGGLCLGDPRIVSWGPNRLDVFVRGSNHALFHKAWDGAAWSPSVTGYDTLGGICLGQPDIVSWGPNRLDVFVIGADHGLYHKWWDGSSWGPSPTGYESLGGTCTSAPHAVARGLNRLDVFVTGTDAALYHKWWDGTSWQPSQDGFERLGGICVGEPDVVAWGPDRLDVFVTGIDSGLYHKWWDGAWGPSDTGYETLGGTCMSQPRGVAWGPNRLDVFVTGTDSALYHKWWDGAAWQPSPSGFQYLGGIVSALRQEEPPARSPVEMTLPAHAVTPSPLARPS